MVKFIDVKAKRLHGERGGGVIFEFGRENYFASNFSLFLKMFWFVIFLVWSQINANTTKATDGYIQTVKKLYFCFLDDKKR